MGYIAFGYLVYFFLRVDHHSLHSPKSFEMYRFLRNHQSINREGNPTIEARRKLLRKDSSIVQVVDLGAGSKRFAGRARSVKQWARVSSSSLSHNLLFQGLSLLTPRRTMVELGTCLGINTAYLAEVCLGKIHSFEGADALLGIAEQTLGRYSQVSLIPGNIDHSLPRFLSSSGKIDFCLLDANHTYEATIRYARSIWPHLHEDSVLVVSDIHWSPGMAKAWREILEFPGVSLSMDFFECGAVFLKPGLMMEKLVLYYPR
ncbi:hypothetical protein ADIS_1176 [Lunatimonas lonarensis]|uniref:Class I SAM-dependent methyltransferase n=2 Tax=Lunatimonas lonarensis TaxID=1232681 RepID=R7ZWB7_9BACT|nr:hypothetical protein ADIS_1176 [Lunatimonas lonarensis]